MGLRIKTNISSINAQRNLTTTGTAMKENMQKLSSGYRINKAADDAAGLAISNNITAKTRSLEQATRNANDGISLVSIAESGMNEITNILTRLRELATQAASDTISNVERSYTNREYTLLVDEIDRIANSTEWNGMKILQGSGANEGEDLITLHVGAGDGSVPNRDTIKLDIDSMSLIPDQDLGLGRDAEIGPTTPGDSFERATAAEKLGVIDNALLRVSSTRATLGAQQSRLNSAINNLGIQIENYKGANSRIRDVDFAAETASFTQNRILSQAGASILAQANQEPELVMSLLR
ncbi:MAG: flagellin [Proteobacteria bacterium]|jgi:flagellin|nr:flagellin [Pseudomonadota bacterium]